MYESCDLPFVSFLTESGAAYTMATNSRCRSARFGLHFWHGRIPKIEELGHIGCDVGSRHDDDLSTNLTDEVGVLVTRPTENRCKDKYALRSDNKAWRRRDM
jgi:hypothetical protein